MIQERQLIFTFYYDEPNHTLPTGIGILPNPNDLDDCIILFVIATLTQILRNRHGLEQALAMIESAGYGKIGDAEFNMQWSHKQDMENFYGELEPPEIDL